MYYNFKRFFKERLIQDDKYVSNSYFIIDKSYLRKPQIRFLDEIKQDDSPIGVGIMNNVMGEQKELDDSNASEFTPKYVENIRIDKENRNINLLLTDSLLAIQEEYYNFVKSLKLKLYIMDGNDIYRPLSIFNNEWQLAGLLFQYRVDKNLDNKITYEEYLKNKNKEREERRKKKNENK